MGISSGRIWPIGWQVDGRWSGLISNVAGELKLQIELNTVTN